MPDTVESSTPVAKILRDWSEIPIVEAVILLAFGIALMLVIKWLVPRIAEQLPGHFRMWVLPWEPILRVIVLFLLFAYVIPMFIHPSPHNLLAAFGALVVPLGFAFKDYASSMIAGVVALYERPYRNGDWIQIEGTYGEVKSLDLRTVQIVTPDANTVSVPHSKMWTTAVYNSNSGRRELMCVADFYVHPDHDGQLVVAKLKDVAWASPFLHVQKPVLVVASEKPWGTHYQLKAYPIDGRDQFHFITDLTVRGKATLRRLNISTAAAAAAVTAQ